jgi:hypothetical protein
MLAIVPLSLYAGKNTVNPAGLGIAASGIGIGQSQGR